MPTPAASSGADSTHHRSFREFDAALDDFFAAIRRARGRGAREHGEELTVSQHHLLAALAERPELPIGQIALAAGVAPPTATRMLDHLKQSGVVEREHSTEDRRVVTVRLTPKGRQLLERKQAAVAGKRRALYESLAPEERQQAERLLRRLAEVIEEL